MATVTSKGSVSGGRPSKKAPEREAAILEALRAGKSRAAAASLVDVHYNTLARWVTEDGDFRDAVEKAEAYTKSRYEGVIFAAAQETWQAAAWWLERRHHTEYGRRDRIDMTVDLRGLAQQIGSADGLDADELIAEAERIFAKV